MRPNCSRTCLDTGQLIICWQCSRSLQDIRDRSKSALGTNNTGNLLHKSVSESCACIVQESERRDGTLSDCCQAWELQCTPLQLRTHGTLGVPVDR